MRQVWKNIHILHLHRKTTCCSYRTNTSRYKYETKTSDLIFDYFHFISFFIYLFYRHNNPPPPPPPLQQPGLCVCKQPPSSFNKPTDTHPEDAGVEEQQELQDRVGEARTAARIATSHDVRLLCRCSLLTAVTLPGYCRHTCGQVCMEPPITVLVVKVGRNFVFIPPFSQIESL